jgi:hypothetical protein
MDRVVRPKEGHPGQGREVRDLTGLPFVLNYPEELPLSLFPKVLVPAFRPDASMLMFRCSIVRERV